MNSAQLTFDLFGDLGRLPRVRNCAACDHESICRQLADQWGATAMACRRAYRDEHFRANGQKKGAVKI